MLNTSCPPILSSGTDNPLRMNGSIEVNPSLLHLRLIASHWLHCPQAFKLLIFYQVVDSPLFRHGVPMLVTAMQVFSRLLVWTLAVRRRKDIQKKSCQRGGGGVPSRCSGCLTPSLYHWKLEAWLGSSIVGHQGHAGTARLHRCPTEELAKQTRQCKSCCVSRRLGSRTTALKTAYQLYLWLLTCR